LEPKDRFLRAMEYEEVDRIATHDNIASSPLLRSYAGELMGEDILLAARKVCLELGIDALRFVMATEGRGDGEVISQDGWVHKRYSYTTWIVRRRIQTLEDFDQNPIERMDEDAIAEGAEKTVEHYNQTQEKLDPIYYLLHSGSWVPGIDSYAHGHLGLMLFSRVLYSEKARVRRDIKNLGENHVAFAKICAEKEIAPVVFGGEDVCTDHGPFIHPDLLRKLFFPYLRRIVKAFDKHDIKYVFHSDGDLWPLLDDFRRARVNGIHPLEPFCGMDMLKVKEKIGDEIVLFGNIDCSATLPLGEVEDVTREVVDRITDAGPGSGYVLGSSSEIEEIVPIPNVKAMFDTVKRCGKFPMT